MAGDEPALNRDVFDSAGRFLACLDMAYLEYFVAVEYQGELHQGSYAHDIELIERLRALLKGKRGPSRGAG